MLPGPGLLSAQTNGAFPGKRSASELGSPLLYAVSLIYNRVANVATPSWLFEGCRKATVTDTFLGTSE